MTVVILQPGYLPWLGFFEQMYKSDIFVIYDDVQYTTEDWRNRNRIKTPNGWQWLTVPVLTKNMGNQLIKEVKIDITQKWRKKHWMAIYQNYKKAKYFDKYCDKFEKIYEKEWEYLIDIDIVLIYLINEILGLKRKIIFSSELNIKGERVERLIKICKKVGADTFYEGKAGQNYINTKEFEREGIKVEFQDYKHPIYNQLYGEFIPYLSVIDLIFNHGEESLNILIGKKK